MSAAARRRSELAGWAIFVLSALCFIIASVRSGDPVSIAGSGLFLLACVFFIAPLTARGRE